jgi:Ser/Thr protein kinase RdoA (MazF antagonist)
VEPPLAVGRTAEVFAWDEEHVIKLFPAGYSPASIEHEARIGRIAAEAQIGAPAIGSVLAVGDREGIVFRRARGVSMLQHMLRSPWRSGSLAHTLGRLHAAMHAVQRPQLPSQRSYLRHAIENAPALSPSLREAVLGRLASLPDGEAVCHGDFHPDNVIMSDGGPVVIDWVTAGRGNPDADVARSVLLLGLAEPVSTDPLQRRLIAVLRRLFLWGYLRGYRSLRPCPQAAITAWMPVIAAARLSEGIAEETSRLLALASQVELAQAGGYA